MKQSLHSRISDFARNVYLKIKRLIRVMVRRLYKQNTKDILIQLLACFDMQKLDYEIRRHHNVFAYLLEPSTLFLLGTPTVYFSNEESINNAWEYCLDDESTSCLQQLYREIRTATGENALNIWMEYLRQRGFQRIQEDVDIVEITPDAPKYYDNTLGLENGVTLAIEAHPWTYNGAVVFGGILKR